MTAHVIALSADLMDRSKLTAAWEAPRLVRSLAKLCDAVDTTDVDDVEVLVIVDLHRVDDPAELARVVSRLGAAGRVVAYGSHVDEAALAAAEAAGAETFPRSVFFRRLANGDI